MSPGHPFSFSSTFRVAGLIIGVFASCKNPPTSTKGPGASCQPALVAEKYLRSSGLTARHLSILAKSRPQTQNGVGSGDDQARPWAAGDCTPDCSEPGLLASILKAPLQE